MFKLLVHFHFARHYFESHLCFPSRITKMVQFILFVND